MRFLPRRGNLFVESVHHKSLLCPVGATFLSSIILQCLENIPFFIIYCVIPQHFQVFFPERFVTMVFFLVDDVSYHTINLRMAVAKGTVSFLPAKLPFGKSLPVNKFRTVAFHQAH